MPVAMRCPECRTSLSVPSKKLRQAVSCPSCKASFIAVPQGSGITVENSPPLPSSSPPLPAAHSAVVAPPSASGFGTVTCPHCRQLMANDGSFAGQIVQCPHCGIELPLPSAGSLSLPQPATASFGGGEGSPPSLLANARYARLRSGAKSAWGLRLGVALAAAIIMFAVGFLVSQASKGRVSKQSRSATAKVPTSRQRSVAERSSSSLKRATPSEENDSPGGAQSLKPGSATAKAPASRQRPPAERPANSSKSATLPENNEPPGEEQSFPEWSTYRSTAGMFSVYMPNKRRESSSFIKGAAAYRQHKVTADVLQFPDLDAPPDSWPALGAIQLEVTWSEVSDEIRQGLLGKLRTVPGASAIRDIECDGVPGIELTIAKKDGPNPQTAKKRAFVVGNRVILLAAYFYHVEKDGEHGVLFGEQPNRFLESLQFLSSPEPPSASSDHFPLTWEQVRRAAGVGHQPTALGEAFRQYNASNGQSVSDARESREADRRIITLRGMRIIEHDDGIEAVFSDEVSIATFLMSSLFTRAEGEQLIDAVSEIGTNKRIGRFDAVWTQAGNKLQLRLR